ncbi:sulfotransferase [Actinopolymorpha pittospori]|uniref:Sulfotransferase family protein n=1 Tax=Actinopolymorpha pittospori TaxID=648752 RepID=A0A927MR25_9ACTN|nr:sulfotransferase [Actinopolymorpha pittospori]MBE1603328.1 hypothetical protein [Actinopolymorpha pittospori]
MGKGFLAAAASAAVPPLKRLVAHRDRLLDQNERLRKEVLRLTLDLESARGAASPLRAIASGVDGDAADAGADLGFLFIVTYGRSGSTLLMGLLDGTPGYCIRGENSGALYKLFEYHSAAIQARAQWTGDKPLTATHPWYGIDGYPAAIAAAHMRQLVIDTLLRPEPGTRVAGFKEIRWWQARPDEYLAFIETLFPGARFILNTRNLEDVARSRWVRYNPNALTELADVETRLREAVEKRGDRGYQVHFDDYVKDPSSLRGLYDWLGEEYDTDRVAKTLSVRHSF